VIEALKSPERVKAMASMMERDYGKRIQAQAARASTIPRELQALDERLAKLRAMPDLTEDERQVLIDKAEAKRRELQAAQPEAKAQAKILTLLPRAAATYLQLIEEGLAGNARSAAKSRVILKDMLAVGDVLRQPLGARSRHRSVKSQISGDILALILPGESNMTKNEQNRVVAWRLKIIR
jgi:hypothetical protein